MPEWRGMIDIHHHLLYGVDDGAPDLEMARESAANGVTHIVCTPPHQFGVPIRCPAHRRALRGTACGAGWLDGPQPGLRLPHDRGEYLRGRANPWRYSIDGKGYLLIEFSNTAIPPQIVDAMFMLQSVGYTLIITHPERYPALLGQPELLAEMMRTGSLVQVTCGFFWSRTLNR